jgi:DNA-binding NarL/FixJ family response regulator
MGNRKVLLVDDHDVVRRGLKDMLRDTGFDVCGEAENGQEGVEQTLRLKPDLVLLDMSMPVMTGLQAAAAIRRLSPGTKIIMVSMHDSPLMVKEAHAAGADAYITKTSAGKELLPTINRLFEPRAGRKS